VISFAGDALICVFRSDLPPTSSSSPSNNTNTNTVNTMGSHDSHDDMIHRIDEDEHENEEDDEEESKEDEEEEIRVIPDHSFLQNALDCAKEIILLHEKKLNIHAGITYGSLMFSILGNNQGNKKDMVYVLLGECLQDLSPCITEAGKGELVCTHHFHELLPSNQQDDFLLIPSTTSTTSTSDNDDDIRLYRLLPTVSTGNNSNNSNPNSNKVLYTLDNSINHNIRHIFYDLIHEFNHI